MNLVDFPGARVAVLEHSGTAEQLDGEAVQRFVAWRRENGVLPPASATFNVVHAAERYDLCAQIDRPVEENAYGVIEKQIPAGRCALLRHVGPEATLGDSIRKLYELAVDQPKRDYPLFFQRVRFGPQVPQDQWITDIFLPLR